MLIAGSIVAKADDVDTYVQVSMQRQHIPGLSLLVLRNGQVLKARGYGFASMEMHAPATTETVYELASTTKPLVATAILLLVQEGKLSLDARISGYLDHAPASWNEVTIRHLLSHTSGIPDYSTDLRHDFRYDTPAEEIAEFVAKSPLKFSPGTKWSYSNSGYVILGIIIQRVTDQTYDEFLSARIFGVTAMSRTRVDTADEVVPDRATGYLWAGPAGMRNGDFLRYMMTYHGDGGILSTVLDLGKWASALDRGMLLSAATKEEMWTPEKLTDGSASGYGLGWFIDRIQGHRHIYHAGGAPGIAADVAFYPDDGLTVILLANGGAAYPQALDWGIAQKYIAGLKTHGGFSVSSAVFDRYCGLYDIFGGQLLKVTREGNSLVLDDGGRLTNAFFPVSESKFVAEDAARSFVLEDDVISLDLAGDAARAVRIGPLPSERATGADPDEALTAQVEQILKAFEHGGESVDKVPGVASQARQDFARGPSVEFRGIKSISFLGMFSLSDSKIIRHGSPVARVVYYRMAGPGSDRIVLVYFTANGDVTDEDVI
jgi:CubicO group peptidase (beta-lactamase class C family)